MGRASIGNVNNGLDQLEIRDQNYGFIYSDDAALGTAETLTMEYWENWDNTHFDTQKKPDMPETVLTKNNMNALLQEVAEDLIPGTTYYYRTVFVWNDRYFFSPEVKSFTTLGPGSLSVGTLKVQDVTARTATLKGHVPFEKIGKDEVGGGFMISKKYSNRTEFVMQDEMETWPSYDDISYVSCRVTDVDFEKEISGLEPNTEYYVCAYICLGREKNTTDKYGNEAPGKKIYLYGDVINFTTDAKGGAEADITVTSTGSYPWYGTEKTGYTSGNQGVANSVSTLNIQVLPKENGTLTFDWTVDSERSFDKLRIKAYVYSTNSNTLEYSGAESGQYTLDMSANRSYRVEVQYIKDGLGDKGTDKATVRNILFN